MARRERGAGPVGLHPHRTGRARRDGCFLAGRPPAAAAREQPAGGVRRRRRAPRLSQASRLRRGRRRSHHPARAPLSGRYCGPRARNEVTPMDHNTILHTEPDGQRAAQGPGAPEDPRAAAVLRPLAPGMRWLLFTASVLVLLAGIQLFVFTGQTSHFFAFTIANPLAAAFLGAAYWAAIPIEALAGRQAAWANARIAVPAVLVFTVLTLAVTLTHLGQLHLGARFAAGTRAVTVAWIAIYVAVPALMVILWLRQVRTPGADPPRAAGLPGWLSVLLAAQAAVLAGVGVALF